MAERQPAAHNVDRSMMARDRWRLAEEVLEATMRNPTEYERMSRYEQARLSEVISIVRHRANAAQSRYSKLRNSITSNGVTEARK